MIKELRIAALDGNSFAGKTSITRTLGKDHDFAVVPEPSEYCTLPTFPPATYYDAKQSVDYFLEIEKRRSDDAVGFTATASAGVIMDRSLWCYLSFQHVVRKRMPQTPNAYEYCLDIFERGVRDRDVIIPSIEILVTPKDNAIHNRRVEQRGPVDIVFLNDYKTTLCINQWLSEIIRIAYGRSKGLEVYSDENDIKKISNDVATFVGHATPEIDSNMVFTILRGLKL